MKKIFLKALFYIPCLLPVLVMAQSANFEQGKAAFDAGRYEEALGLLQSAAVEFKQQGASEPFADCQLMMVQSHIGMGAYEEGARTATEALDFIRTLSTELNRQEAEAMSLIGEAQLNLGRNDLALEYLLKAEKIFGEETSEELAECYEDLGLTYWNNENYDLAIQYHEQALEIREDLFGETHLLVGDSYNNLGLVDVEDNPYLAASNFEKALGIYEQDLGANHPKVAFCLNNLARAQSNLGNFLDAIRYLERAQEIWGGLYEGSHPNKAFTISNLGRVYEKMGSLDEAMARQKEALKMYIDLYGEKHPEVANTYFIIATLHTTAREWKEAVTQYQEAIYANLYDQDFQTVEDLPELDRYYNANILLTSLWNKAKALENLHLGHSLKPKHLSQALETVSKCDLLISQIRQLRLNESDKLRLSGFAKEIYEKGISLSLDLAEQPFARNRYYEQAFAFSERSKSAILLEAIADTQAKDFAGIPAELLATEDSLKDRISYLRQKLASLTGSANEQEWKELLFSTQSSYRSFVNDLETAYPRYFNLKYQSRTASIAEVRAMLEVDEAILSYFEGDSTIYLFLVDQKNLRVIEREKSPEFLKQILGLRNGIKFRLDEAFHEVSEGLYEELVPKLPKNIRRLLIIPDGALATIPFEVLSANDEKNGRRYLLQDYAISYDYSATLHLSRLSGDQSSNKGEILLMAPVSFEKDRKLSALAGSATEVENLKYLFKGQGWGVEEQTEEFATEASIKSTDLSRFKYLHLATHGVVHESEPELSCIYLKRSGEDDGILYAGELYNLKIGADLVTLSACETGLGKIAKGEGIVGLSRALLYAGAKNLIVSLWQVADQSTAELMIQFYQNQLNNSGSGISEALREAKLSMLASEDFKHPYYWGPFILVGR